GAEVPGGHDPRRLPRAGGLGVRGGLSPGDDDVDAGACAGGDRAHAAGPRAKNGTLYITLEPCSHTRKRTPPCVPAILAAGIRRVVVAMRDPNPQVNGAGLRHLTRAGLRVTAGCLERQAGQLNDSYVHRMRTGRPLVVLKMAMTLDGKTATAAGESRWITGPDARRHAHRLRSQADAIMVGINTVLADDPQLTIRLGKPIARQPLRVIMDSTLKIPLTARVVSSRSRQGTLIATTRRAPHARLARLRQRGISVLVLPGEKGKVSLRACLKQLARMGINRLLIEGGSELAASALQAGVVNRLHLYIAPRLLGGTDAKGVIGGSSPHNLARALSVSHLSIRKISSDLLIEGIL
ncbi:MAG: bifunctional diaminohydroxyphosphoribosylaminopyrimidine deaminase/5-amino-6-(5-phosphoribosylamino)uracil reductase RibD, partial [Nitrospirota bacterium]